MKIVLASRNRNKVKEINAMISNYLSGVEIVSLDDVGLYGDVEETGTTFEENARLKAQYAAQAGYIAFADDSGLAVHALDGAPGVYSARYAGGHGDDQKNRDLLLENLKNVTDRRAEFVCCIACVLPSGKSFAVHGRVAGEILHEERGTGGFGYDNLFLYVPANKSFAEMSPEEKNAVSHRRLAIKAFAEALTAHLEND